MSKSTCLMCGGTGRLVSGDICPECSKSVNNTVPIAYGIPLQYQGVAFDKSFLPDKLQKPYGEFMENLLLEIISNSNIYQKNLLICNRPTSGKTVWAYNLYSHLISKGLSVAPIKDILEVRTILTSYGHAEEAELFSTARCAIVKIPRDIQPWTFDTMSTLIERRVRNNGFTIFIYGGQESDLKNQDKFNRLSEMKGSGAFNTVKLYSFY